MFASGDVQPWALTNPKSFTKDQELKLESTDSSKKLKDNKANNT